MSGTMQDHDLVGIQSAIDLRELRESQSQQLSYRGDVREEVSISRNTAVSEKEAYDLTSFLIIEDVPLRYDVDIVTKLIVHAGIGMVAVYPVPMLFQLMFQAL